MRSLSPENDAIELRRSNSTTTTANRTLLVLAAQHGDEPCGVHAVNRLLERNRADPSWPFGDGDSRPAPAADDSRPASAADDSRAFSPANASPCAFDVVRFVLGNPKAFSLGRRQVDENLNRCFPVEDSALSSPGPTSYERGRAEGFLSPLLREADAVLDLHSASAPSPAFAMVPPSSAASLSLARSLLLARRGEKEAAAEIRYALRDHTGEGLGLAIEWSARHGRGGTKETAAVTVECGQHSDPLSVDVAASAIEAALAWRGEGEGEEEGEEESDSGSRSLRSRILVVRRGEVVREGFRWRWREEEGGGEEKRERQQPPPEAFRRFAHGQLVASDDEVGELRCDVEGGALIVLPAASPVLGEDAFLWGEEDERE